MGQSAVEWLANELYEKFEMKGDGALFNDLLNQANKIFEKQIQNAYKDGSNAKIPGGRHLAMIAEQYYNGTFSQSTPWYDEDQITERMNIIGQNGNDGEHYQNK